MRQMFVTIVLLLAPIRDIITNFDDLFSSKKGRLLISVPCKAVVVRDLLNYCESVIVTTDNEK